jgi:hypothetical protein
VPDVRAIAAAYGVRVELDDLGAWNGTRLVAEYDPDGPVIRLNERAIPSGSSCLAREHIDRAIAHELYHHREAIGEIPRLKDRAARERAADAFAEQLVSTMTQR